MRESSDRRSPSLTLRVSGEEIKWSELVSLTLSNLGHRSMPPQ